MSIFCKCKLIIHNKLCNLENIYSNSFINSKTLFTHAQLQDMYKPTAHKGNLQLLTVETSMRNSHIYKRY